MLLFFDIIKMIERWLIMTDLESNFESLVKNFKAEETALSHYNELIDNVTLALKKSINGKLDDDEIKSYANQMVNLFVTDLKKRVHDSFDKVNRNVKQVVFDEQRKESLLNNMGKSLAPEELEKSSMAKESALGKTEASSMAKELVLEKTEVSSMAKEPVLEKTEVSSTAKEPALEKAEASSTAKNQLKSSLDGFRVIEIDEPEKGRHR